MILGQMLTTHEFIILVKSMVSTILVPKSIKAYFLKLNLERTPLWMGLE